MLKKKIFIKWIHPTEVSKKILSSYQDDFTFLYSGLSREIKNSFSYIGLYPKKVISGKDFNCFDSVFCNNFLFGYISYDLKNSLESLIEDKDFFIKLPKLYLIQFHLILKFDHDRRNITIFYTRYKYLDKLSFLLKSKNKFYQNNFVRNISSNFSKVEYLNKLSQIKKRIKSGDIYQANLTRKFVGNFFFNAKDTFNIFLNLSKVSPANFSSFLRFKGSSIISSSPELFLKIKNNEVISTPIKGTSPRSKDKIIDQKNKEYLINSSKEKAENLMITDLVRNDLSRVCKKVEVKKIFGISVYTTVYHMYSKISAIKNNGTKNIDVIKALFPPGSMTGAPKINSMNICSELEKSARGVYSGAIGFFYKEVILSVVIRTIIINKDKFEFQVGGGITHDSDKKNEWEETMNKAKAVSKALNISLSKLKNL